MRIDLFRHIELLGEQGMSFETVELALDLARALSPKIHALITPCFRSSNTDVCIFRLPSGQVTINPRVERPFALEGRHWRSAQFTTADVCAKYLEASSHNTDQVTLHFYSY